MSRGRRIPPPPDWLDCSSLGYAQSLHSLRRASRAPRATTLATTHGSRTLAAGAGRPGTRFALPLVVLVAAAVAAIPAIDTLSAASLVARAARLSGAWSTAWPPSRPATTSSPKPPCRLVPGRCGPASICRRSRSSGRSCSRGVHMDGIDEARLVKLAGDIAATGLGVVTAELSELREYRITPTLPDLIEDTAIWAASDRRLAPDGRMGLVGISFSGGLSLVAAGRPALAGSTAFTLSFGGHGDLARTLRFLCTGVQPDGVVRPPHDYGVVVVLLNVAHLLVPAEQVAPLRLAIRTFLRASSLDMVDKAKATRQFARATEMETGLPEPARALMHDVNTRNVRALEAPARAHRRPVRRRARAVTGPVAADPIAGVSPARRRRQRRAGRRIDVARRAECGGARSRQRRDARGADAVPQGVEETARLSFAISAGVRSRQAPDARLASVSGPIRTRRSVSTGWPAYSHMRRTCRLRPSRMISSMTAPSRPARLRNDFTAHRRRCGAPPVDDDAALERGERVARRHAAHDRMVDLFDFVPRMREARRQVAVVREQQQALGIGVETTDGMR